jgi:hypothetical protein
VEVGLNNTLMQICLTSFQGVEVWIAHAKEGWVSGTIESITNEGAKNEEIIVSTDESEVCSLQNKNEKYEIKIICFSFDPKNICK